MNPDEPLRTKNLAEEDPAPMDDTLGGYPWLPRMIDKARASAAGTLGGYYRYPCPIDQECLRRLGIDPYAFLQPAISAATPSEILRGLDERGSLSGAALTFDPVDLNARLHDGPGS